MADFPAATPQSPPDWQVNLSHPLLSGRLSLQPSREGLPSNQASPMQFSVDLTTSHPLIQQLLTSLGPIVAQLLPILLVSLLGSTSSAPAPATTPSGPNVSN